jgi:hypothetical protein
MTALSFLNWAQDSSSMRAQQMMIRDLIGPVNSMILRSLYIVTGLQESMRCVNDCLRITSDAIEHRARCAWRDQPTTCRRIPIGEGTGVFPLHLDDRRG